MTLAGPLFAAQTCTPEQHSCASEFYPFPMQNMYHRVQNETVKQLYFTIILIIHVLLIELKFIFTYTAQPAGCRKFPAFRDATKRSPNQAKIFIGWKTKKSNVFEAESSFVCTKR